MRIYRWIYSLVRTMAILTRGVLPQKIRGGIERRLSRPWKNLNVNEPIWIHCSSGEYEYARPLIRELDSPVLLTYFSTSTEKAVQNDPGIRVSCICPWDDPQSLTEFLDAVRPTILLIARTDLWPEMLEQCRLRDIPVVLFSLTIGSGSSKLKHSWYFRPLFEKISQVHCVSEEDAKHLKQISSNTPFTISGDTRFDQVAYRMEHPQKDVSFYSQHDRPVIIFGSIWDEDFEVLRPCLESLGQEYVLVFAPHEPTESHLSAIETELSSLNIQRLSQFTSSQPLDVLMIDQVGWLADFYPLASVAFVGGSFRKQVHSVMEALAAGCLTVVGPMHLNNREAVEFQTLQIVNQAPVQVIDSADAFEQVIKSLDFSQMDGFRRELRELVRSKAGASQKVISSMTTLMQ